MQLSSHTALAVTSLTWPRRGPTLFLSLKMLGTRTNTACSLVRGLGVGPGGVGQATPGFLEEARALIWMDLECMSRPLESAGMKRVGEPGEVVKMVVPLQGLRYRAPSEGQPPLL